MRSTLRQSTPRSEHFWTLRCWKSVRRCGAKRVWKLNVKNTPRSDHFWRFNHAKLQLQEHQELQLCLQLQLHLHYIYNCNYKILQLLLQLQQLQLQLQPQLPLHDSTTTTTTTTTVKTATATTLHYYDDDYDNNNNNYYYNYYYNYNSGTLQPQLQLQLQLKLHYATHPVVVVEVTTAALPKSRLQSPFGPSVDSLCHPCIATFHLSYSAPSLKLLPPPCTVVLCSIGTIFTVYVIADSNQKVICIALQAMARDIGALDYLECSALSGAGVDDIIDGAMWAFVMDAQTERGKARTQRESRVGPRRDKERWRLGWYASDKIGIWIRNSIRNI